MRPFDDGSTEEAVVVAVADGMGGAVAGEVASRVAIEAAMAEGADAEISPADRVRAGNDAVLSAIGEDYTLSGMGTTLTLGLFDPSGFLHVAHIGDSRLYVLRNEELQQVTTDHTLVAELVALGQITEEQAETHPRRHLVTRVIGTDTITVDELEIAIEPGDRILLCSDGLTTMLRDPDVADLLRAATSASDAAWSLVEAANAAGGTDNTTVAVVDVSP
ncbi:MAG: protein phosphatase 2C domain-containing protein [Acidimicrobiia bacterium]|nr:protein phosphatase 2C domain-containing protein [Acidimicrobiia bacterium]